MQTTLPAAASGVRGDERYDDRILVSILNWNGIDDTLACLAPFNWLEMTPIDCLVLDNGSSDDPSAIIKREFPHVEIIRQQVNLGFTGGHNLVMQLALDRNYGSVLLLNSDCVIDIESILRMQEMLDRNADVAAVSPLIYCDRARRQPQAVGGWLDWEKHQRRQTSQPGISAPPGSPTHVLGTALLLRCAALRQIGLLDNRYFAYYEDNDLSARIAKHGYQAVYCDTAIAFHRYRKISEYSALSFYLSARNAWLFWSTHTPGIFKKHIARDLISQHLLEIALLKKNAASKDKLLAVVDGFWDAQMGRFGPPPKNRTSPKLLRMLALMAPFFLCQLISSPIAALRQKLGLIRPTSAIHKD